MRHRRPRFDTWRRQTALRLSLSLDYIDAASGEPRNHTETLWLRAGDTVDLRDEGLLHFELKVADEALEDV